MSKKKKKNEFDWRIQVGVPIGVALITSLVACITTGFQKYFVEISAIAEKCKSLESDIKVAQSLISEKNERIADQRAQIASLEGLVQTKTIELTNKDNLCEFLKVKYFDKSGRILAKDSDVIKAMQSTNLVSEKVVIRQGITDLGEMRRLLTSGTVIQRLGLREDMSPRNMMLKGWNIPLLRLSKPGVFIPAPDGVLDAGLAILDALSTNNLKEVIAASRKAYRILSPIVDPVIMRGSEMDVRLSVIVSMAYRWVAEEEFSLGNYKMAADLIGTAAGVVGPKPPPYLLAMESAMQYRHMNGRCGYYTIHIHDAVTKGGNDPDYMYEIHNELAKLGYLQLYFPNKEGTDVGERIKWETIFNNKKLNLMPTYTKNGDIWSKRWCGLGKYEEYNLSAEFRRLVKTMAIDKKIKVKP